jgi:LysR family glycine cleavage system transcriptional activator
MVRRLPPLNALPSFEAAARLLSFSRAAEELHVTHGAVSRAIRNLEDQLGVRLFERATRSVQLTAAGAAYAGEVREALDLLAAATLHASGSAGAGTLNVSTLDGFASRWLVPRLYRFRAVEPDIDVRIATTGKLANFTGDGIDIAVRFGAGRYPGVNAEFLLGEDVFPVCSPKLLEGPHPLRTPDDLRYHTLIRDAFHIDWAMWLRAAGVEGVDPHRGLTFDSASYALEAAIQGQGVVLGRSALITADLAAGRLVRPFDVSLPAGFAYYVVYPRHAMRRRAVKAFRDWLFQEVEEEKSEAKTATLA